MFISCSISHFQDSKEFGKKNFHQCNNLQNRRGQTPNLDEPNYLHSLRLSLKKSLNRIDWYNYKFMTTVLFCKGCHNEVPKTEWLWRTESLEFTVDIQFGGIFNRPELVDLISNTNLY